MRQSVRDNARPFDARFEGTVDHMYCDNRDLVTCGVGDLIDPVGSALALHWVLASSGALATVDDVVNEWIEVKRSKEGAHRPNPRLVLPAAEVTRLFFSRLDSNEHVLSRRWARWAEWPADAQLGAHSCAWAAGSLWRAPRFDACANAFTAQGFAVMAGTPGDNGNDPWTRGEAWLRDTRPEDEARGVHGPTLNWGLRPRNLANRVLFHNASRVLALGLDPETLHYPAVL